MPFSSSHRRLFKVTLFALALVTSILASQLALFAQNDRRIPVIGYVTASHLPEGFDVNDLHVTLLPSTQYGIIGKVEASTLSPLRDALQVGSYVEVSGGSNRHTRTISAEKVFLRADWDQKLSGVGVIDKVLSAGPEPVVRADGYRIRIATSAQVNFGGDVKSLEEIAPNMWLRYEGKRDQTGTLVAAKVTLLPARATHFKAISGLEVNHRDVEPAKDAKPAPPPKKSANDEDNDDPDFQPDLSTVLDKDGNLLSNARIRMGTFGGWHTIPADKPLQDRVRRVGASIIPAYQKALPNHHPSFIPFRFFAVDDTRNRSEICYLDGLILIPKQVVERLENDDQLAAVLADGVAYNLQRQGARTVEDNRLYMGTQLAADLASVVVPGLGLASLAGSSAVAHKIALAREQERDRISLSLLADAGYDPRQAPEAWRRLAPRRLPDQGKFLPYPERSGYQLSILKLQFSSDSQASSAPTAASR